MALIYSKETGFKNEVMKSSVLTTVIEKLIDENKLLSVHRYGKEYEIRYNATLNTRPGGIMWIKHISADLERLLIRQPSYAAIQEIKTS
jgi:hypothetical protein